MTVHSELGYGFLESAYQAALELVERAIQYEREHTLSILLVFYLRPSASSADLNWKRN